MSGWSVRLLLIDNYDSFTYNLVQAFMILGAEVDVRRNDEITVEQAKAARTHAPVHFAGAGHALRRGRQHGHDPRLRRVRCRCSACASGISPSSKCSAAKWCARRGSCTARLRRSRMTARGLFAGLPQSAEVGRYHSLIAKEDTLPAELEITARTPEGEIMGVRHRTLKVEGVQFHPESVLTPDGPQLIGNFLKMTGGRQ